MVNRKITRTKLPAYMTTGYAGDLLGVSANTIKAGCNRWGLGQTLTTSGSDQLILLPSDVIDLSQLLQDGPGAPPN